MKSNSQATKYKSTKVHEINIPDTYLFPQKYFTAL